MIISVPRARALRYKIHRSYDPRVETLRYRLHRSYGTTNHNCIWLFTLTQGSRPALQNSSFLRNYKPQLYLPFTSYFGLRPSYFPTQGESPGLLYYVLSGLRNPIILTVLPRSSYLIIPRIETRIEILGYKIHLSSETKIRNCICLLLLTSAFGLRISYPGLSPRAIVLRPFRTKKPNCIGCFTSYFSPRTSYLKRLFTSYFLPRTSDLYCIFITCLYCRYNKKN